jgi:transposase
MLVKEHQTLEELERLEKAEPKATRRVRLRTVLLAQQGWTAPQIVEALGRSRRTVQRVVQGYNAAGLAGLEDRPGRGRKPRLTNAAQPRFLTRVDAGPVAADQVCTFTGRHLCGVLEKEFGVLYTLSGVYELLHRHGYSWLMPRPQHEEADLAAQEAFKQGLAQRLPQIAAEHPGQELQVWFQDEARFGQQGTLTRVWARTGRRPRAVKQTRYDWLHVLAAVCPRTGQAVGLLAPELHTAIVNAFFEQFAREVDPKVHAVLVWDQAGWHMSQGLRVPSNVTLIELPPKSPELNPVENLWHYLRSHHWSNRAYADYDELRESANQAWQKVCLNADLIRSICAVPYLERQ